jgi:hypothetical protein
MRRKRTTLRRELVWALAAIEDHRDLMLTEWKRVHDDP